MRSANRYPALAFTLIALLLALALAGLPGCAAQTAGKAMTAQELVAEAQALAPAITVADAKSRLAARDAVFIDVREPGEFSMGHLEGAVNIPRGLLEFKVAGEVPDKTTPIVIYCKSGGRGSLAAATLARMGYSKVVNMQGGWDAWMKAGYPAG